MSAERLDFHGIRKELHICESFSPDLFRAALNATATGPAPGVERVDRTSIPLFTIDPAGSVDLDQALWIEEANGGAHLRLYYAIADVGAFIEPAQLEEEAWKRGVTAYSPDARYGVCEFRVPCAFRAQATAVTRRALQTRPSYPRVAHRCSQTGARALRSCSGPTSIRRRATSPRSMWRWEGFAERQCGCKLVIDYARLLQRATVLSRRKMSYVEAQASGRRAIGCLPLPLHGWRASACRPSSRPTAACRS